jgi:hypothetical protein
MAYGFLQRWTRDAQTCVVAGDEVRYCNGRIGRDWEVVDVGGDRVGSVAGTRAGFLVVSRGWLRSNMYVPLEAIAGVEHSTVRLNESLGSPAAERWSIQPHRQ